MMNLKLFIVMSVSLEIEMISWINIETMKNVSELYLIHDLGVAFQAIFIFMIFVCNTRVLKLLNRKFFTAHSEHDKLYNSVSTVRARSNYCKPPILN